MLKSIIKSSAAILIAVCISISGFTTVLGESVNATNAKILFSDGFEYGVGNTTNFVVGSKLPVEWTLSDLRDPADYVLNAGVDDTVSRTGKSSLGIEATKKQSLGFLSPRIYIDWQTPECELNMFIRSSEDYENNKPKLKIEFYKDEALLKEYEQVLNTSSSEWVENTVRIDRSIYPDKEFNNIRVRLFTLFVKGRGNEGTGKVYYDDFVVRYAEDLGTIYTDVRCDDSIGWYHIGETVTFKPMVDVPRDSTFYVDMQKLPKDVTMVTTTVRDSTGNVVASGSVSGDVFNSKGWSFVPDEVGHYRASFIADTPHGKKKLVARYKQMQMFYDLAERQFVVAEPSKPMEERSDLLYSSHYEGGMGTSTAALSREDTYRTFDEIGFRGLRLHPLCWDNESVEQQPQANPAKGLYNFSDLDYTFEMVDKYGFNIIAVPQYTPQWASPWADFSGTVGTKMVTSSNIRAHAVGPPTKNEFYTEFLRQLAERYGEHITGWEIWNEMTPGSRWWELGTPEEYVALLKDSRELLNELQPGEKVVMGGLVGGSATYWGQLLDAGIYDYTDCLVIHGTTNDYDKYLSEYNSRGLEPKPWWNSEAHFMITNTYSTDIYYSEDTDALRFMKGCLREFAAGCECLCYFQTHTAYNMEALPEAKSLGRRALSYGLYTRYPYPEPRLVAKVANTFFNGVGLDFKYVENYLFDNETTRVMNFENDGRTTLYVWNEKGEFALSPELLECMTDETKIIDWEGREVSWDETLRKSAIYIINGLDESMIDKLEPVKWSVIDNAGSTATFTSNITGSASKSPIFNKKTFAVSENVVWNENDWAWVDKLGVGGPLEGYDAKFAFSAGKDGIYLMVEVTDNTISFNGDDVSRMYNDDSVQFSIAVTGEAKQTMYSEFQLSMIDGEPVVFKQKAADVSFAIPSGWTTEGAVVQNEASQITINGNKILYKVFLPASELYPFKFDPKWKEMRISVLVNDNDGEKRHGLLRWSNGIDGGKNITKFGKIVMP